MLPEVLAFLAGVFHAFSLPGLNLEFLAWFSLVPLFIAYRSCGVLRSILVSFVYSSTFLTISHLWLVSTLMKNFSELLSYPNFLGFLTFVLFVLYESLFFIAFGVLQALFREKMDERIFNYLFLPASYTFFEYLRSLGDMGYTGAMLSDAFYRNHLAMLFASTIGSYGLLFVAVLVNSFLSKRDWKFSMVFIGGLYTLFYIVNSVTMPMVTDGFEVKLLQTNDDPIKRYEISLSDNLKRAEKYKDDLTLLTPEAFAAPYPISSDELSKFPKGILFGTAYHRSDKVYNGAIYRDENGLQFYDKVRLFPFAEFLPYPKFFSFLSFLKKFHYYTPGDGYHPIYIKGKKVGVLICFESYFEEGVLSYEKEGADFVVVLTNDGWFKSKVALWQHFAKAAFRAAESGLWIVQVANNGITGVVDSHGRIVNYIQPGIEKASIVKIGERTSTLYGYWYKYVPFVLIGIMIFSMFFVKRRRGVRVWR